MPTKRRPGRRIENPPERTCRTCSILKPIDQFQQQNATREQDWVTYRHSCKECETAKAVARYHARGGQGQCPQCGKAPEPGKKHCLNCIAVCKQAQQAHYLNLRAEVLFHYGAACSHCGDPRLECLELDHVGGWGTYHRDDKGRRISGDEMWRWLKKNGFPDTVRLLCGSCHSALSYWGFLPRALPTFSIRRGKLMKVTLNTDAATGLLPVASPEVPTTAPGP